MPRIETYTYEDFNRGINILVDQISHDKEWKPDYIVGLVRGGAIPAVYLSHRLDIPVIMVHWSERDNRELNQVYNTHEWIANQIKDGKKILIVDDIVDSGESIKNVIKFWESVLEFKSLQRLDFDSVRVAALLYNISQMNAIAYYYAESIDRKVDKQWFEFFWERKENY